MATRAIFDLDSAKRIAAAVRHVERTPRHMPGGSSHTPVLGGGGGASVRIVRITTALGTTAYGKYNARTITPTTITGSNWTATTGAPTVAGMFGTG